MGPLGSFDRSPVEGNSALVVYVEYTVSSLGRTYV
jgi:hypothetical protein